MSRRFDKSLGVLGRLARSKCFIILFKNVSIILNFFSRNGLKILGWKLLVTMTITTTTKDLVVALQVS